MYMYNLYQWSLIVVLNLLIKIKENMFSLDPNL